MEGRRIIVLGINSSSSHDPSAAIMIDGRVVAAAEEERFTRSKHARGSRPVLAARYCLEEAGVRPEDVDVVSHPWSMRAVRTNALGFARRSLGRMGPLAIARFLQRRPHRRRRELGKLRDTLDAVGIDSSRVEIAEVEHHVAHAASAQAFSGFEDCAVVTIDGVGELTSALLGEYVGGRLERLHEVQRPDSLGFFYSAITDYLGFAPNDGEYKVMGMAAFGDPSEVDFSDLIEWTGKDFHLNRDLLYPSASARYDGRLFTRELVARFGPPREGDGLAEPYIHIAAAAQQVLEQVSISLIEAHLGDALRRTGRLCVAGGCALNVVLNRKLIEHPLVNDLYVPPAPHDAGLALGGAALASAARGCAIEPLPHAYWGPSYTSDDVRQLLQGLRIPCVRLPDPAVAAAELLERGEIIGWFQGRMEWGPRALGNRSILAHPAIRGTQDEINRRVKFREGWRPFCPAVLDEFAAEMLGSSHPSPFMTYSFELPERSRRLYPEITHVDGTARPQIVTKAANPLFHTLLSEFMKRTGLPSVVNTSLNRRGEPMICSPSDAIAMFFGSGLEHLILEDIYVSKRLNPVDVAGTPLAPA